MGAKVSLILMLFVYLSICQQINPIQKSALLDFYSSTNGNEWKTNTNWLQGDPCADNWFGITCSLDTSGEFFEIEILDLGANLLTGSLPSSLGDLSSIIKM